MTTPLSLIGNGYVPTASLSGQAPSTIFRGRNARVRGLGIDPYVECYLGSKDLGENFTLTAMTGSLYWTSGSTTVSGTGGTVFTTELRPGQMVLSATEIFVVNKVESDTSFIAERAPTTTVLVGAAGSGYRLPVLFELDGKRGVLLRGNAILLERKDILLVGDGDFFLNGVDTTFNASRIPKRLQRSSAGTYTEYPFGFPDAPPGATFANTTGGWKGMQSGSYSFMASWYNDTTRGFSNPSQPVKQVAGVDITIAASGRFTIDITSLLLVDPTNADGVLVWGSLSGGGVSSVNASNFSQGPWYETVRLPFATKTITAVDTTTDQLTVPGHGFKTGDYVIYKRTGGADIAGLTSGTAHADGGPSYWVIVVDDDTIRLANSVANLKITVGVNLTGGLSGTNTLGFFDNNDVAYFEYLDAEVGQVASGDNDTPPECEWVCDFAGQLQFISCFGNRKDANDIRGAAFGSFIVPGKGANREAAPYRWRVGVEEDITGFAKGAGKLFLLTRKNIPFITPTGRTELARLTGTPLDLPFTWRPFWTKGSVQPYSMVVIQSDVYFYSGSQALRAPSTADVNTAPFEIGRIIADLTKDQPDGHVLVTHDPKNQQACIILSGIRKNSDGYWESEIIPLDLALQPPVWQPKILLTSATQDMIVSGAAYVNNRLEFLAGGRVSGGTFQTRTYRYDERLGTGSVAWSVVFQPTDNGIENRAKEIKSFRGTGRLSTPIVQVHGATWASSAAATDIDPDAMEAGTGSITGNISLTSTNGKILRSFRKKRLVKNLSLYAVRMSGTWVDTGSNKPDRLDELVIEVGTSGGKQ